MLCERCITRPTVNILNLPPLSFKWPLINNFQLSSGPPRGVATEALAQLTASQTTGSRQSRHR